MPKMTVNKHAVFSDYLRLGGEHLTPEDIAEIARRYNLVETLPGEVERIVVEWLDDPKSRTELRGKLAALISPPLTVGQLEPGDRFKLDGSDERMIPTAIPSFLEDVRKEKRLIWNITHSRIAWCSPNAPCELAKQSPAQILTAAGR